MRDHGNTDTRDVAGDAKPKLLYGVTAGGTAQGMLRGQMAWMKQHFRVTLACSPDAAGRETALRETVEFAGIDMKRDPSPLSDLRALIRWVSVIRSIRPDVTNVSTPKAGLLGGVAAWLCRVPKRVYVMRGLRLEGASGMLRRVLWVMERISIATSTDVIFVSESLARAAQRENLLGRRPGWLIGDGSSNGVDSDGIAVRAAGVDRHAMRAQWGVPERSVVLGYVGRLVRDKGIDTLLAAMQDPLLAHDVVLVAIGSADDPGVQKQLLALPDKVVVLARVADVAPVLAGIDVLCLPTRREGFPNIVLEAAAVGVPAITTRATGAIDSVVDGVTGYLVGVDDPEDLTMKINLLAFSPQLRQDMGAHARDRARDKFAPERIWSGVFGILAGRPTSDVRAVETSE